MGEGSQTRAGRAHLNLARSYAQAAEALRLSGHTDKPFWHLIGHGLELSLKAALLFRGTRPEVLLHLNHDLSSILLYLNERAPDYANVHSEASLLIEQLDIPHCRGDFRYPSLLQEQFVPEPAEASRQLELQIQAITQSLESPTAHGDRNRIAALCVQDHS